MEEQVTWIDIGMFIIGIGTCLALVLTLIAVVRYARDTRRMAKVMTEELGLAKKPVVTVFLRRSDNKEENEALSKNRGFLTTIHNHSNVHAWVRIEVNVAVNGEPVELPEPSIYSGFRRLGLAARASIDGEINLDGILNKSIWENTATVDGKRKEVHVAIYCWAVNYHDTDPDLTSEHNRSPEVAYIWRDGRWAAALRPSACIVR